MNTKNVLMLVILSAGMLTGLTATMIQAAPVYADTEDCEDNDDKNCNENTQETGKITQENDCKVVNDYGNGGNSGTIGGNDNKFVCTNTLINPNTGQNAFGQQGP